MTETSYPFVGGSTTDAQFSQMFAQVFPSSVIGYYGSSALQVVGDSSGMQVKVQPGAGCVRGHFYNSDAVKPLTIGANTSGSARIDTVVLHLEYGAVNSITAKVVQGTPGSGAATLTQTLTGIYELALGDVAVASGASTVSAGNVTDRRPWWGLEMLKMAGLVVGSTQPAPGSAFAFIKTA